MEHQSLHFVSSEDVSSQLGDRDTMTETTVMRIQKPEKPGKRAIQEKGGGLLEEFFPFLFLVSHYER